MKEKRSTLEMAGKTYGRLTVQRIFPGKFRPSRPAKCECVCTCGNTCTVNAYCLRSGDTSSCGCLRLEMSKERFTKHGMSASPEHKTWCAIKGRCHNPNDPAFHYYGGRGIKVCKRWLDEDGFKNFLSDMGPRPSPKYSLDRYPDQNGDYSPSNCRWATDAEQSLNRRNVIVVTINGARKPLATFIEEAGLSRKMVHRRWQRGIRGPDLLLPSGRLPTSDQTINRRTTVLIKIGRIYKPAPVVAKEHGIPLQTLHARRRRGVRGPDLIAPVRAKYRSGDARLRSRS